MSVCNRADYKLYAPPTETASHIKKLEREGAVVVGNTKLASFAATEELLERVGFQAPWNPRGDGYQPLTGSSSSSGAQITSYCWLDILIESDSKAVA